VVPRLLSLRHPALAPHGVLLAKLLAAAWVLTGHASLLPRVHLPRLALLEGLPPGGAWRLGVAAVGLLCALAVLVSRHTRLACLGLAAVQGVGLLAARGDFQHNRLFCALLLALLGLSGARSQAWLPRAQVALLYLGAGLDKLGDADWRGGRMLSSLLAELARYGRLWAPGGQQGAPNTVAALLSAADGFGPHGWLGLLLSWGVITGELLLAAAFLLPGRAARWGALGGSLALQVGVYLVMGGPMGMFVYAGLAAALLAVPPAPHVRLLGAPARLGAWLRWLDVEGRVSLGPGARVQARAEARVEARVEAHTAAGVHTGARAWLVAALALPAVHLLLAVAVCGPWVRPSLVLALALGGAALGLCGRTRLHAAARLPPAPARPPAPAQVGQEGAELDAQRVQALVAAGDAE
jgi:hypothetical protein